MTDRLSLFVIVFLIGVAVGSGVLHVFQPAPQVEYVDRPMNEGDLRYSVADLLRHYEPPEVTTEDCIQIPKWLDNTPTSTPPNDTTDTTAHASLRTRQFVLLPRDGNHFSVTTLGRNRIQLQTILPTTGAGMDVEIDRSGDFFWGPLVGVGYTTTAQLSARVGAYVERGNFRLSGGVRAGDNLTQENPVTGFAELVYTPTW